MKLIAVLTTFNRRALTLACLAALTHSARCAGLALDLVVVDDASTDGTADAVRSAHPGATVLDGGGDLFWNRGMHLGLQHALQADADFVLWINDDTLVFEAALAHLLKQSLDLQAQLGQPVLLVGATEDALGQVSYGGARALSRLRRFTYRRVWSASTPLPCEVMNGNCVLLPMAVARRVGNLDPHYEHAMGDTDYALRARRVSQPVYAAAGTVGRCAHNPVVGSFNDNTLPLRQRWRALLSRKGLPWRSWLHFTRRHGGLLWPLYFSWPYARVVLSSLFCKNAPAPRN
jgi:GT2 family glycosyltransferase